jgi:hypothetical protein
MAVAFLEFTATRIADSNSRKRRQLFIRTHNETLSVVAMRACNPGRSTVTVARQLQRACHRPRRWVISFSFKRK